MDSNTQDDGQATKNTVDESVQEPNVVSKSKRTKSILERPDNSVFTKSSDSILNDSLHEELFKLHIYRPNGTIRPDISKAIFTKMAGLYGDIIRCIPSIRWSSSDEICELVWNTEKRSYRKTFERSRKQIEHALAELAECGLVLARTRGES